jgi:hypothetical protein
MSNKRDTDFITICSVLHAYRHEDLTTDDAIAAIERITATAPAEVQRLRDALDYADAMLKGHGVPCGCSYCDEYERIGVIDAAIANAARS